MMLTKERSRSLVKKGPVRSAKHLDRVRQERCLVCGVYGVQAHHLRIGLRTMGVRKDDTRAVPLCPTHHDELHRSKEEWFWAANGIDPVLWCENFMRNTP